MNYVDEIISTLEYLRGPSTKKDNRVKLFGHIKFYVFLYNLKCELSPDDDITLAEDDPLEIAHQFDLMRKACLKKDLPGVFDEMCNSKDN